MIIDFHTHIFPPFFRNKRDTFFTGEPSFKLLYSAPGSRLAGRKQLMESMDKENIRRSVIFGFPWENADHFQRHNDYIMESVHLHPDRFIGFCCFSPLSSGAAKEAERCLESGLSGVGEIALYQSGFSSGDIPALRDIMEICVRYDVPFLLHTNEPVGHQYPGKTPITLKELYDFIREYPSNRIVLAHWGGGIFFYALMRKEVRETLKNVWFDTAASPYLYTPGVYGTACDIIGYDKILFGSDYPLLRPIRYFKEMDSANLSEKAVKAISGENALHLLKLFS